MDEWPAIRCPKFDGEGAESYRRRSGKIAEIVTRFRRGDYSSDIADEMEALLERLRAPEYADQH